MREPGKRSAAPRPQRQGEPGEKNDTGLPDDLRAGVEALSGVSLQDVRVRRNSAEPARLLASAYTKGREIHLGPGQEKHLPHEAWHVVQQKQGRVKPTIRAGGYSINADRSLEREADRMGREASRVQPGGRAPLESSPGAAPAASGAGSETVQCWLDVNLLRGRTRDRRISALAHKANTYNGNRKGKSRKDRVNELHKLEVSVYQWFDAHKSHDLEASDAARWAKGLMNEVQREHQDLIRISIESEDEEPPIAGFDDLEEDEQEKVKKLWGHLRDETGNVRITETEDYTNKQTGDKESREHEGFRYEVLSQFARLLETETGRDIVSQVDQNTKGQRLVTIRPGQAIESDTVPGSEFAAGPVGFSGQDKLKEVDISGMFKGQYDANRKRQAYSRNFIELDLDGIEDPKERAKAIYEARRYNPSAKGVRIGGKHYQFGKGTAVDVTMTRDIPDAHSHHTSRMVDEEGKELIFPNFMTLGHELGHAIHMQGGVALGGVSGQLFKKVAPQAKEEDWSDLEEYGTINTVENALRSEYGLSNRYGHINQPVFQKRLLEPIANELFNLSDEQPHDDRAAVEQHITVASTALIQLKVGDARGAIRSALQAFVGQVDTVFTQFTNPERNQVKTTLRRAITDAASPEPDKLQRALQGVQQAIQHIQTAKLRVQQAQQQQQQQQPAQQQGGGFNFLRWLPFLVP